jgi:hypothetical protein
MQHKLGEEEKIQKVSVNARREETSRQRNI